MNDYYFNIGECKHNFTVNRCDEPVPQIRQFCMEQEKCLMQDPGMMVKHFSILFKLFAENTNEIAQVLSNRALFLLCLVIFVTISSLKYWN